MRFLLATAGVLAITASATAQLRAVNNHGPLFNLDGTMIEAAGGIASPLNTTYGVFTGESTAQGNLALLESSAAPTADDVVNYDLLPEQINSYVVAAGGITRTVTETLVGIGNGTYVLGISISGSGDLFPAGLSVTISGQVRPLVNAVVGIGLGLPASLGGTDPLTWPQQPNAVSAANVNFRNTGTGDETGALDFLPLIANPLNWNGVFALQLGGITGAGVNQVDIQMVIAKAPEPSSLVLLAGAGLLALRRRC